MVLFLVAPIFALQACGADEKPPAPDDATITAVVAHFTKNGVNLAREREGSWWVVTDPKGDGYDVIVALRTFPPSATEQEMRDELKQSNLAFMLNTPAHVAMSHPGLRAADPATKLPGLDQVPIAAKMEKLFEEYRPPESKPSR
jgi:hypothetical protein